MKRLYQKIYLTIVASLLLVVAVAGGLWRFGTQDAPWQQGLEIAGELVATALPPPHAPRPMQQEALERLSRRLDVDMTLYDRSLRPIASVGRPLPPPRARHGPGGWLYGPQGPAWSLPLPDDRVIVVRAPVRHRNPVIGLVFFLGAIALVIALCAYPVVRGLTRRLERLQTGVETLGAGDLSARVKIGGRDEVARLAESFNRAAARIEDLVGAHRLLLANASHELRTPLSRLRLGIELYEQTRDAKYKTEIERDIAELESMVEEILLASRLEATRQLQSVEPVDLLATAAEEARRYDDTEAGGQPATAAGDPRLLRRLIRNLLENAHRHGKPPVRVVVREDGAHAVVEVSDAGAGIPLTEAERVFTPFYRLSSETGGAGLGLALCRQIARLHGGDVTLVATDGGRTCFRIVLPLKGPG